MSSKRPPGGRPETRELIQFAKANGYGYITTATNHIKFIHSNIIVKHVIVPCTPHHQGFDHLARRKLLRALEHAGLRLAAHERRKPNV